MKSFLISPILRKVWPFLFLTQQHKCFSYCIYCILLLYWLTSFLQQGFPSGGSDVRNLPTVQETQVPSLGQEDPLEKGLGYSLQYSCLENFMDRGAWWATVHGVAKSWTQLSDSQFHFFLQQDTNLSLDGCSFPIFSLVIWVEFTPPLFS